MKNGSDPNAAYNKMKNKLIEKTSEISTLFGVDACLIIYGPNQDQPETWSSQPQVEDVINKFMALPDIEVTNNMFNQESFLLKKLTCAREKLEKLRIENRKMEMEIFMFRCLNNLSYLNNASNADKNCLMWAIDQKLKDIDGVLKGKDEAQYGTIMAPNATEALNGKSATVGDAVKGMIESNMAAMENQDCASDLGNDGVDATLPFGDANLSNEFKHGSSTP